MAGALRLPVLIICKKRRAQLGWIDGRNLRIDYPSTLKVGARAFYGL
jgi:hypothetical protein